MKHQSYMNRALKAHDPRYARIFGKLGYDTTALPLPDAAAPPINDVEPVVVAIPDDWRDMPWLQLKLLAGSISNEKIKSKDDAFAAVELELERREEAGS